MSAGADQILEQLNRLITKIETGQEAGDHTRIIKPVWKKDPFRWMRERLKIHITKWSTYHRPAYEHHKWDGTPEPLWRTSIELAKEMNVAVSSGTGTGKTFLGALLVFWWLDCFGPASCQVVTVAPKKDQLTLHIWKEIGRLWHYFEKLHPQASLDTLRIRMRPGRDDWGAVGFICGVAADEDVANKARGFHAEHILFIHEETTGIDPAIIAAIQFTCTAPHNLRLYFGNPDSNQDSLATVSRDPGVVAIRASGLDHPNIVADDAGIIPGAISTKVIAQWREKYGEESPLFQSRARGIPPEQSRFSLIRREWAVRAMKKTGEERAAMMVKDKRTAMGVDCANSEAGDKACIAYGRGTVLVELKSMNTPDTNAWARQFVYPYIESSMVLAKRVGIDSVGVGAGALNELRRLGAKAVQPLNAGESPWPEVSEITKERDEEFRNLRGQMWWQLRKDLQADRIALPDDPELLEDLLAVHWEPKNGYIVVEPKEDVKARLPQGRSTDKGDAVMQWNWIRQFTRSATFEVGSQSVSF